MNDKLDEILDLLRSQNEMIKDIHDYVKEVTSEKYIGESREKSKSIKGFDDKEIQIGLR